MRNARPSGAQFDGFCFWPGLMTLILDLDFLSSSPVIRKLLIFKYQTS